jgi:hypothetical protein
MDLVPPAHLRNGRARGGGGAIGADTADHVDATHCLDAGCVDAGVATPPREPACADACPRGSEALTNSSRSSRFSLPADELEVPESLDFSRIEKALTAGQSARSGAEDATLPPQYRAGGSQQRTAALVRVYRNEFVGLEDRDPLPTRRRAEVARALTISRYCTTICEERVMRARSGR